MNLSNQLGQPLNYIWGGLLFLTMTAPSLWFMFGAKSMVTGLTAVVLFYCRFSYMFTKRDLGKLTINL